jgi:hypothetical protein
MMTRHEKIKRAARLNSQLKLTRERLGEALGAMDYDAALESQIEVHDIERELRQLDDPWRPVSTGSRWIPANSNFRVWPIAKD